MRKFISYGKPTFDPIRFRTVNTHLQTKPGNGFWACDYNPNGEYYSDWEETFFVDVKKLKIQLSEEEKNFYKNQYNFVQLEFPKRYLSGEKKQCIDIKDWAVPSICVFNPDVITEVETFEPNHHQNIMDMMKKGVSNSEIIESVTQQIKRPEFVAQIMEYSELDYQGDIFAKRNRYEDSVRTNRYRYEKRNTSDLPVKQNKLLRLVEKFRSIFHLKGSKTQKKVEKTDLSEAAETKIWDLTPDQRKIILANQSKISNQFNPNTSTRCHDSKKDIGEMDVKYYP